MGGGVGRGPSSAHGAGAPGPDGAASPGQEERVAGASLPRKWLGAQEVDQVSGEEGEGRNSKERGLS